MTEKKRTEHLLKRFEAAEQDAIEGVMRRIGKTEAKIAENVGKIPRSLSKELDAIRGRLENARRTTEDRIEEFRSKLIDGPLREEELRARLVMLEMEYASRVRLAEQGFDLLADRFEDHVASGRNWLSDICDQVRSAVRLEVKPVRAQLGEALVSRARALAARERELEDLRRHRETLSPLEKKIAALEDKNSALETQFSQSRSEVQLLSDSNAELETRIIVLTRELEKTKTENEDMTVRLGQVEGEADQLLEQLRGKEGESSAVEKDLVHELRNTITPLLDERLGLRTRIQALEKRIEVLKESEPKQEAAGAPEEPSGAEKLKKEMQNEEIAEKDKALAELIKELSGFRDAAGRFGQRVQGLEAELASAKAELKEMRQERRGLVERFNAAAQARDVERKRAEKAEAGASDSATKSRVMELEMKLAAAARGLGAVREKVEAARARIYELESKAVPEKDETLDIDADKADLAQRVEEKNREIAALKIEMRRKSSALEAAQKAWVSMRQQLTSAPKKVDAVSDLPKDVDGLREETRIAKEQAVELSNQLATERKSAKMMQKRLFEADVARDRALSETRAQWADEQESYEEKLAELVRENSTLKIRVETSEQSWQETLARQDAERMQEIFKLRAEVQNMKWKLEGKEK